MFAVTDAKLSVLHASPRLADALGRPGRSLAGARIEFLDALTPDGTIVTLDSPRLAEASANLRVRFESGEIADAPPARLLRSNGGHWFVEFVEPSLDTPPLPGNGGLIQVLDRMSDGLVVLDADGRYTFVNRAAERYFGKSRDQIYGKTVREAFPKSVSVFEELVGASAVAAGPRDVEILSPTFERWVSLRVFPSAAGTTIYFRDITEKKEADDVLRASEARYRTLFENALDGILLTAPDGRIFDANPTACALLQRSVEEIRRAGRTGVVVPDERLTAFIEERRRAGHAKGEVDLVRADGSTFTVEASSAIFRDAFGEERTSMVFRDLSARKRVEQLLKLSSDVSAALSASLDGDAVLDAVARMLVPSFADACVFDVFDDDALRRVAANDARQSSFVAAMKGLRARRGELALVGRALASAQPIYVRDVDPSWIDENVTGDPHHDVAAKLDVGSVIVVPLRMGERALGMMYLATVGARRFEQDDVTIAAGLAARIALALDNAQQHQTALVAKRLRDEVLQAVAHDLRNPLNTIALFAMDLRKRLGEDDAVVAIRKSVQRADRLIQDLVTAAMVDAGTLPLHRCEQPVAPLLDELAMLFGAVAKEHGVDVATSLESGDGQAFFDRDRVLQLLSNLVANAVKFTPRGGGVRVSARVAGPDVVFAVADTGCGIAPDHLPHVFDRFWQSANAHRGGAGLGLAIAKGIAEAHGGHITVESEIGKGTTFTVVLPAREVRASGFMPAARASAPAAAARETGA